MSLNWVDIVLLLGLAVMVYIGSKRGLIRELMAFSSFIAAVVVSVRYLDFIAAKVTEHITSSTLWAAVISFVVTLALGYGVFKGLGWMYYKIGDLHGLGQKDKVGGAIVGGLRGWVTAAIALFLSLLAPLPERYHTELSNSMFGGAALRTLPLIYETTTPMHPSDTSFIDKLEQALLTPVDIADEASDEKRTQISDDREHAYTTFYRIDSALTR